MSLENNSWINTDHKLADAKENFDSFKASRGLLKIPSKQFALPPDGRLNHQADQENFHRVHIDKEGRMFDPNAGHHHQGIGGPQENNSLPNQSQPAAQDTGEKATMADFPFCYGPVGGLMQKQDESNLECGVVTDKNQPYRFEMAPAFGYNYALVNQMSLAAAATSATYKCDVCGLTFTHLSLLNHHRRIHDSEEENHQLFPCTSCNATFSLAADLKQHKDSVHKPCTASADSSCDQEGNKKKMSKCESCNTKSYQELCNDSPVIDTGSSVETDTPTEKGHYPVKRRKMATVTKCEKCNGTGIVFIGEPPPPSKPFHCNICDGTFSRYSSLWSHRKLHSGEKPFKCNYCGAAFARAAYLKNHTRVHTGERPYKCTVCGMQFSQAPHLKSHERIHSGERPFECDLCSKRFARHSTLWNHRRIHTGEKPYECQVCGTAFNQMSHLKNHAKVHTGEKPHKCDICCVRFSDKFALKRHRSVHEKYGQTAPAHSSTNQSTVSSTTPQEWKEPQPQNQQQSQPINNSPVLYKELMPQGSVTFSSCPQSSDEQPQSLS